MPCQILYYKNTKLDAYCHPAAYAMPIMSAREKEVCLSIKDKGKN